MQGLESSEFKQDDGPEGMAMTISQAPLLHLCVIPSGILI